MYINKFCCPETVSSSLKMKLCVLLVLVLRNVWGATLEASPCPRLFVYEDSTGFSDRWYGIITLLSDSNLSGTWLRIMFDRPLLQLGSKGVHSEDDKIFRTLQSQQSSSSSPRFPFKWKSDVPEEIATTTPSTTTEHLFTSKDETGVVSDIPLQEFTTPTPTPQAQFVRCDDVSQSERNPNQVAQIGEFPWHVALYYTKEITIAYLCGASLISLQHLVTVAHCVVKGSTQKPVHPDRLVVYLGKYYLKHWAHEGTQTRYVSHVIPHPDYKPVSNRNDIALIKMFKPVDYTDVVRPVCLWNDKADAKVGTVVGWGFDESGKIEEKLMHVEMTLQDDDVCNASIANYTTRFGNGKAYCSNFFQDTTECVGDSGGGMVFRTDEENGSVWHLRGLVTNNTNTMRLLMKFASKRAATYCAKRFCHTKAAEQVKSSVPPYVQLSETFATRPSMAKDLMNGLTVYEDFLTDNDEASILSEIEPYLQNLHYEFDHWDDAIHGYRETERLQWTPENSKILDRVRAVAFTSDVTPLKFVHILDLNKQGYIKPHIDSTRFCGDTITGLSLLTDCIMKLVHDTSKELYANILLKRRSLYVMKGAARFDYTHEILANDHSMFKGARIEKDRRISVICRNSPNDET
ncbi:hypothetical protein FQR65_LT00204 [Abscondita terminalis]|nr:hypothetical protein FQR65_LT00204 [Abscondita terminalis]